MRTVRTELTPRMWHIRCHVPHTRPDDERVGGIDHKTPARDEARERERQKYTLYYIVAVLCTLPSFLFTAGTVQCVLQYGTGVGHNNGPAHSVGTLLSVLSGACNELLFALCRGCLYMSVYVCVCYILVQRNHKSIHLPPPISIHSFIP